MKSFPFHLIFKEVLQQKYYIHTTSAVQKTGIAVGKSLEMTTFNPAAETRKGS